MDDLVTRGEDTSSAFSFCEKVKDRLQAGGFKLRK